MFRLTVTEESMYLLRSCFADFSLAKSSCSKQFFIHFMVVFSIILHLRQPFTNHMIARFEILCGKGNLWLGVTDYVLAELITIQRR